MRSMALRFLYKYAEKQGRQQRFRFNAMFAMTPR